METCTSSPPAGVPGLSVPFTCTVLDFTLRFDFFVEERFGFSVSVETEPWSPPVAVPNRLWLGAGAVELPSP
ncbi:MAG: hypothetical protein H0T15_09000 [Thermoleophilaceae bacterium]|nr:hypothetical protein [Thermoleophilaceae bacterium]